MGFYGKPLTWNCAHCVYILASSSSLYKIYIINKVFTEFPLLMYAFFYIINWCNLRKTNWWSVEQSFILPSSGHSYKGVTARETINSVQKANISVNEALKKNNCVVPKMKISLIIDLLMVFQNPWDFYSTLKHKICFKETWQISVSPLKFHLPKLWIFKVHEKTL